MRTPFLAILAAAAVLAGCATPQDAGTNAVDSGTGGLVVDTDPGNIPPAATLQATPSSGAPPLKVVFSLGARDPEGDAMSWALDFGDGSEVRRGTQLPIAVEHEYARVGAFAVTFTVGDGSESSQATVTIRTSATQTTQGPPTTGSSPPPQPAPPPPPAPPAATPTSSPTGTTSSSTSTTGSSSSQTATDPPTSSSTSTSDEPTSSSTSTTDPPTSSSTTTTSSDPSTTSSESTTTTSEPTSSTTTTSDSTTSTPPGNETGDP